MNNKSYNIKRELLFEALEAQRGIVSDACKAVDISRVTFYRWLKEHEDLKEHFDNVQEATIDYVENKLFDLIGEKNVTSIIFYLKTKAKHRGYVEKQEFTIDTTELPFDIKIESRKDTNAK